MRRIAGWTLLAVFGVGACLPVRAQDTGAAEYGRQTYINAKKQEKINKVAAKKREKAMKKYIKAQRKAAKKANRKAK